MGRKTELNQQPRRLSSFPAEPQMCAICPQRRDWKQFGCDGSVNSGSQWHFEFCRKIASARLGRAEASPE